jgi:hypothetical protein
VLTRFAEQVIPLVRREVSTTLSGPLDAGRAKGLAQVNSQENAMSETRR